MSNFVMTQQNYPRILVKDAYRKDELSNSIWSDQKILSHLKWSQVNEDWKRELSVPLQLDKVILENEGRQSYLNYSQQNNRNICVTNYAKIESPVQFRFDATKRASSASRVNSRPYQESFNSPPINSLKHIHVNPQQSKFMKFLNTTSPQRKNAYQTNYDSYGRFTNLNEINSKYQFSSPFDYNQPDSFTRENNLIKSEQSLDKSYRQNEGTKFTDISKNIQEQSSYVIFSEDKEVQEKQFLKNLIDSPDFQNNAKQAVQKIFHDELQILDNVNQDESILMTVTNFKESKQQQQSKQRSSSVTRNIKDRLTSQQEITYQTNIQLNRIEQIIDSNQPFQNIQQQNNQKIVQPFENIEQKNIKPSTNIEQKNSQKSITDYLNLNTQNLMGDLQSLNLQNINIYNGHFFLAFQQITQTNFIDNIWDFAFQYY